MSARSAEAKRRMAKRIGRYDKAIQAVPDANQNGHKGKSQKGCFGGKG